VAAVTKARVLGEAPSLAGRVPMTRTPPRQVGLTRFGPEDGRRLGHRETSYLSRGRHGT
jgi:hypothetical protein